ncbi:endo alpha-1,4 polygalactosaminidase [Hydrogenimonas sp.]
MELNVSTTWQWQLTGTFNTSYDVDLYDIDLFDTDKTTIDTLHEKGRIVVCYFSAGSYEEWRPDAGEFPVRVLGNALDGWPGERWLDVRDEEVRAIMKARLDLAQEKGCDGVEPDNVDGYANDTGFALTYDDQLDFNRFLAAEAHARGLLVGLKNDLEQVNDLLEDFDFALNEECHAYDECDLLVPFVEAGKPVFNAEYDRKYVDNVLARDALCEDARRRNFRTLILPPTLDGSYRYSCD